MQHLRRNNLLPVISRREVALLVDNIGLLSGYYISVMGRNTDPSFFGSFHDKGKDILPLPGIADFTLGRISAIKVFAATKILNVANPLGRKVRKHFFRPPRGIPRAGGTKKRLKKAGVNWVGRTIGTCDGYPKLEDGRVLKVKNIIWCTGFITDYSWIDIPIFDDFGFPVHERGVVQSTPGLYFIGMPFQRTLSSSLLLGVGKDAGYIANHIASNRLIRMKNSVQGCQKKLLRSNTVLFMVHGMIRLSLPAFPWHPENALQAMESDGHHILFLRVDRRPQVRQEAG